MNPTSVATTTVAAFTATQGGELIEWLGQIIHLTIPENVAMTLATLLVPIAHALYNRILSRVSSIQSGATT